MMNSDGNLSKLAVPSITIPFSGFVKSVRRQHVGKMENDFF